MEEVISVGTAHSGAMYQKKVNQRSRQILISFCITFSSRIFLRELRKGDR